MRTDGYVAGAFTITRSANLVGAIAIGLTWGGTAAFPGDSDTLRSVAVDNNATDEILLLLDDLPEGRQFETVEEVWEAVH